MKKSIILLITILFFMVSLSTSFAADGILPNLETFKELCKIIGTYGLSVVLVVYYVFFLRKKEMDKYSELANKFGDLNRSYIQLRNDLKPNKRIISIDQTRSVGELGLDRDYYKLYKRMIELCEKWEADNSVNAEIRIENYMVESIIDTIKSWEHFTTPIGSLKKHFTDTKTDGEELGEILCNLVKSDKTTNEKIRTIDALLLNRVLDSKRILNERLSIGDRRGANT